MDQYPPQNQTLQQELQALGGSLTHDTLFREVFQWLGLAKAFLRIVLSEPILAKLDLDRLTVEPRDFLSVIFKETRADVIYKVPLLGREESLRIYIILEHKSFNDFFAIFQADGYADQIRASFITDSGVQCWYCVNYGVLCKMLRSRRSIL